MFLIVGLGNPGEKYVRTRHNAGFLVVDELLKDVSWNKDKYAEVDYWQGEFAGFTTLFVKPYTYMNLSGKAVREMMDRDDIDMNRLVVVYDDIDLPIGEYKISFDRGAGGHNGIKSVMSELEDKAFLRIRIGIAPTDDEAKTSKGSSPDASKEASRGRVIRPSDTASFVLKEFSKTDLEKIINLTPTIREILKTWMEFGKEVVMNKFN